MADVALMLGGGGHIRAAGCFSIGTVEEVKAKVLAELKKVIWPSSKQTVNNTMAVIVFTLIAALIVFVLDLCFDSLNKYAITPLQEKIQASYKATQPTTEENTEASEGNVVNEDAENFFALPLIR